MDWTFDHLVVPFMKIWRHKWPLLHLAPNVGLTDEDGDATIWTSSYRMIMNCESEMSRAVSRLCVFIILSSSSRAGWFRELWLRIVHGVDPDIVQLLADTTSSTHTVYLLPVAELFILHPGLDVYIVICQIACRAFRTDISMHFEESEWYWTLQPTFWLFELLRISLFWAFCVTLWNFVLGHINISYAW